MMTMYGIASVALAGAALCCVAPLHAQSSLTGSEGSPAQLQEAPARPPVTAGAVLRQTAAGTVGGVAGLAAAGTPLLFAAFSGRVERPSDAALAAMLGSGIVAGTTYGVHWAGRRDNLTAHPLATAAGVVLGAALVLASGTPLTHEGDDEYAGPNVTLLIAPALGGSAAFLLGRRARR
jgi:hypothetical protein